MEKSLATFRHVITFIAGLLAQLGWISAESVTDIVTNAYAIASAVVFFIGLYLSFRNKDALTGQSP